MSVLNRTYVRSILNSEDDVDSQSPTVEYYRYALNTVPTEEAFGLVRVGKELAGTSVSQDDDRRRQ